MFASLTVGIALGTPDYERAEDLLRDGDTALHRAKASSTRRYEIFEPGMRLQVMERLRVESELRRALERDELRLHYQPILSLATGQVEGFEGLVRWHHPERGLVMPDKFIRIAEETGLIAALGRVVMRQACRQLREWLIDAELPLPVWISVNVSAKEFLDPEFVGGVRALVEENQIPRAALRIEITETTLLEGDQFVRASLERLRELGVGIDIDDFGTGYSSLGYLQQLPIDTLKIDRVFVKRLAGPAADPSIVRAILDMAKSLGLSVVAEGVETRQQLERLAHLGCQKAQGFYISAAVESAAARSLLLQGDRGRDPRRLTRARSIHPSWRSRADDSRYPSLRDAQLREPGGDVRAGLVHVDVAVDVEDLAVLADVEGPALGETDERHQDTVGLGDLLLRVGEERVVEAERLGELLVLLGAVGADPEVGHVEVPDLVAALTERLALPRSATGESLGEPGQDDRLLVLVVRERVGLAVGSDQRERRRGGAWPELGGAGGRADEQAGESGEQPRHLQHGYSFRKGVLDCGCRPGARSSRARWPPRAEAGAASAPSQ